MVEAVEGAAALELTVIASLVLAGASSLTAGATLINSFINRKMIKLQGQMKELTERDLKMREEAARKEQIAEATKAAMWDLSSISRERSND